MALEQKLTRRVSMKISCQVIFLEELKGEHSFPRFFSTNFVSSLLRISQSRVQKDFFNVAAAEVLASGKTYYYYLSAYYWC